MSSFKFDVDYFPVTEELRKFNKTTLSLLHLVQYSRQKQGAISKNTNKSKKATVVNVIKAPQFAITVTELTCSFLQSHTLFPLNTVKILALYPLSSRYPHFSGAAAA